MTFTIAQNTVYQYTKSVAEITYIYGYAVITLWILMSNDVNNKAPFNQLYYSSSLPTPTNTPYVGATTDSIYATAWLDLSNTPISITTPDTRQQNRWYTIQLLDIFGNTFANLPGVEKNRPSSNYFIVGPSWTSDNYVLPVNTTLIISPSNIVYLIAIVEVKDHQVSVASTVLHQINLVKVIPDAPALVIDPISEEDTLTSLDFFKVLMQALNYNYASVDKVMLSLFKSIGLSPNEIFDPSELTEEKEAAFYDSIDVSINDIIPNAHLYAEGIVQAGSWQGGTKNGVYDDEYLRRAYSAYSGPAANVPEEQFYLISFADSTLSPFNCSAHNYTIHFSLNNFPLLNTRWGFWSITLYDPSLHFYANSLNRYALGTNYHDMVFNNDGSLDLYIQHVQPDSSIPSDNWLPCPDGSFILILRLYSPSSSQILDISNIPPVLQN